MEASTPVWEGVEHGWGHLRGRRVTVVVDRPARPPARAAPSCGCPAPTARVAAVEEPLRAVLRSVRSIG